jgi:hypothetical protein
MAISRHMNTILKIADAPKITNIDSLPRGTGAKYLECMTAHRPELPLIALRWRRSVPKKFDVLIQFVD